MTLKPQHIRAGRAMIDATQDDLAKAAKLSLATLNNIEREVAHPRQNTFDKIRLALSDAGVEIINKEDHQRIEFTPTAYLEDEMGTPIRSTFTRLISGKSLVKAQRIVFFSYVNEYHRCGLLLEGAYRQVIYMGSGLDPRHRIGLAELAAVAIAARKVLKSQVHFASKVYIPDVFDAGENEFSTIAALPTNGNLNSFLELFPESTGVIEAAKTSQQHPLFHVLPVFEG